MVANWSKALSQIQVERMPLSQVGIPAREYDFDRSEVEFITNAFITVAQSLLQKPEKILRKSSKKKSEFFKLSLLKFTYSNLALKTFLYGLNIFLRRNQHRPYSNKSIKLPFHPGSPRPGNLSDK